MPVQSEAKAISAIARIWHRHDTAPLTLAEKRVAVRHVLRSYVFGVEEGEFSVFAPTQDPVNAEYIVRLLSIDLAYDKPTVRSVLKSLREGVNQGRVSVAYLDPAAQVMEQIDPTTGLDITRTDEDRNEETWLQKMGLSREITKIAIIAGGSLIGYLLLRDLIYTRRY